LVVVGEEEEREAVVPQPNRRLAHAMDRAVSGVVLVLVEEEELKLVAVEMVLLLVGLKLVVVKMVL
jgi:hypothetical protein|tara:strand:- start:210 stop:407 length:198 start_codon:yes stop_codon:yes gene_type:complete